MRPTEKASITEYVAMPDDVCCVFAVTAYPPIKARRDGHEYTDGGWVSVQKLHADCRDHHSLRARWRRAWRTFWGCPDTEVYIESDEELAAVFGALGRAANYAFWDTRAEAAPASPKATDPSRPEGPTPSARSRLEGTTARRDDPKRPTDGGLA